MKLASVKEGSLVLRVPDPKEYKLDSRMPVFYNPVMQLNRDITVLLLSAAIDLGLLKTGFASLDLLSATGVKGLRIAKEVAGAGMVTLNDINKDAVALIKRNAAANKLKVRTKNKSANILLASLKNSFHFIDVDPFGTPVPFLDAAIKRLKPHGVIGVTATDTSALCGAAPSACLRKYGALPLRCPQMKELGLRILIRKIQEVAAQYDVALEPVFSHSSHHYLRAFLKKSTGSGKTDAILKQHGYAVYCGRCKAIIGSFAAPAKYIDKCTHCKKTDKIRYAGPLWAGKLWDNELASKMEKLAILAMRLPGLAKAEVKTAAEQFGLSDWKKYLSAAPSLSQETAKLMYAIEKESKIDVLGFYGLHEIGLKKLPKVEKLIEKLREKGYAAERTHFSGMGIKTDAPLSYLTRNYETAKTP